MILLDTHVLVWLDSGSAELGSEAIAAIDREFADDTVAVSAISFWEIGMLVAKGRLAMSKPLTQWRGDLIEAGLQELPVDGQLGIEAAALPDFHGDPADRLIVATAMTAGCGLLTADRQIAGWSSGKVQVHDARQ